MSSALPSRHTFESELALSREVHDFATEARCLMALADLAREEEEYLLAEGLYGQAWAAYERTGDLAGQARSLRALGHSSFEDGRHYYEMALAHFRALADEVEEAETLLALATFMGNRGQNAFQFLSRALSIYEQRESQQGQARALELLCWNARLQDKPEDTRFYAGRLLTLYEQSGDTQRLARTWLMLACTESDTQNRNVALYSFTQALTLFTSIKDIVGVRDAVHDLQMAALNGLEHDIDALTVYREVGDIIGQIEELEQRGQFAYTERQLAQARALYEEALALERQVQSNEREHRQDTFLFTLSDIAAEAGDFMASLAYYQEALEFMRQTPERFDDVESFEETSDFYIGSLYEKMADAQYKLHHVEAARRALLEALSIYEASEDYQHLRVQVFWRLAEIEANEGNDTQARHYFQQAWDVVEERRSIQHRIEVLWRRGRFEWSRGNRDSGINDCAQALKLARGEPNQEFVNRWFPIETRQQEFDAMQHDQEPLL